MAPALPALSRDLLIERAHAAPEVSVVVPAWNESSTLASLAHRVRGILDDCGHSFELIFVDDGSEDDSEYVLRSLQREDPRIRPLMLDEHLGKSAALQAGFAASRGPWVVSMDADLQDLPEELPRLLATLQEDGVDMVQTWRRSREDAGAKVLASRVFNLLCWAFSGVRLRDVNCGYKAFRRPALQRLRLDRGLHRFVPVLAHRAGLRVVELPVRHARRASGKSRYGFGRCMRGLSDLLLVVLLPRLRGDK